MRVFAVSDIHVDYSVNASWVANLSEQDYKNDVLILAGDVSDSMHRLEQCFRQLSRKFCYVFFVPGNHDIWVHPKEQKNSIEKFEEVLRVADFFGIVLQAETIGDLHFLPLYSWYDYTFGEPSDYIKLAWMDFKRCVWPEILDEPKKISEYFLAKNNASIERSASMDNVMTISFSHFLPRIDVIPKHKREIYPVLGSKRTDEQIRAAKAKIHIYGHSHVNRNVEINGVRYINNAFAYPSETMISRKRLLNILD